VQAIKASFRGGEKGRMGFSGSGSITEEVSRENKI